MDTAKTIKDLRESTGMSRNTYNDYRYLDVYVQNKSDNSGYEIYGFVLFEATDDNTTFDAKDAPLTAKTNGFVSDKYDDSTKSYSKTEKGVDIYETSNVKISKAITGAMADKNNKFPFKATVNNGTITNNPIISYQVVGDNGTLSTTADNPTATMKGG